MSRERPGGHCHSLATEPRRYLAQSSRKTRPPEVTMFGPSAALCVVRAALFGLRLVARDEELQEAIRRELKKGVDTFQAGEPGRSRRKAPGLEDLAERRRKLLELYYAGRLSAELFAEEEARLSRQIE